MAAELKKRWPEAPKISLLESIFVSEEVAQTKAPALDEDATVTIIYTSGTSGEPKA